MSRYVPMTVECATLAYIFVYLSGRKNGVPRGWRCLKNSSYKNPLQKIIRILRWDKRTERNILPSISIRECRSSD